MFTTLYAGIRRSQTHTYARSLYNLCVLGAKAVGTLIFVSAGDEADSLAPEKSLNWGTDMLVVSAN